MDRKLTAKDYLFLSSMLFGLFFGAGNLIFPASMGQNAGANLWPAIAGFCLTGVGLPLLGIVAMGISRSEGMFDMASKVGRRYSYFFTCALYLTIGPLFAIPRTATVSFSVGILPMLPPEHETLALCVFSALFFLVVLYFSLRPSGILTWVGKILNPVFLLFLGILTVTALIRPMGDPASLEPMGNYAHMSFFQGFLDGYNTVDAPAALAFGIVLITAIRGLGVQSPKAISASTVKAGFFSTLLMAAIYCMLAVVGAQSRAVYGICADGGEVLYRIATHYFGPFGGVLLGVTVTAACLKTAIGLITSCATTFVELFPKSLSYRTYTIVFCLFSFGIANFGLSRIIAFSLPVLMFLYPLTITLILLCLIGGWFGYDRRVFAAVTIPTALAAFLDLLNNLPQVVQAVLHTQVLLEPAKAYLPFFQIGMGWVVPAAVGLVIGLILHARKPKTAQG
jgi:LIVCS family branched-chain amino acid:cation transporter